MYPRRLSLVLHRSKLALKFLALWCCLGNVCRCNGWGVSLPFLNSSRLSVQLYSSNPAASGDSDIYDVIIVGAGLVGCATGAGLARHHEILSSLNNQESPLRIGIFEQAQSIGKVGAAIGLYPNGRNALNYISPSVYEQVLEESIPGQFYERRDLGDQVVQITNTSAIQATAPVFFPWYQLQELLIQQIPESMLNLGYHLDSFSISDTNKSPHRFPVTINFWNRNTNKAETLRCRTLIGCDGIQSKVRNIMSGSNLEPTYYGKVMYRAILNETVTQTLKDRHILPPAGTQVSYQGNTKGQSFSLRETTTGIATVTAGTVYDATGHNTKSHNNTRVDRFRAAFQDFPPHVQTILNLIDDSAVHEDVLRDIPVATEWSRGPVLILGDAAHAMTPHMGQGANMGLEDACVLIDTLLPVLLSISMAGNTTQKNQRSEESISNALTSVCKERYPRVREVHAQSRANTIQSNNFNKDTAATPFSRRNYTVDFKQRLYEWQPPSSHWIAMDRGKVVV